VQIRARTDGQGRPLGLVLRGAEAFDSAAVFAMMAMSLGKPRMLLADKGYDGDAARQNLL
jgi:hypothetical protein